METDLMGIVHHACYVGYFEAARIEWLRNRGVSYADWATRGIHLPVVDVSLRYHSPARFDETLTITTTLSELRVASLRYTFKIHRDDTLLAEGTIRLACVDDSMAVRRFDDAMLAALRSPELPKA